MILVYIVEKHGTDKQRRGVSDEEGREELTDILR